MKLADYFCSNPAHKETDRQAEWQTVSADHIGGLIQLVYLDDCLWDFLSWSNTERDHRQQQTSCCHAVNHTAVAHLHICLRHYKTTTRGDSHSKPCRFGLVVTCCSQSAYLFYPALLVTRWLTVSGWVNHFGTQKGTQVYTARVVPTGVGAMSTQHKLGMKQAHHVIH